MILRIILLIFSLLPKDIKKAALEALQITTLIKTLLERNANLLEWTELDERYIAWYNIIESKTGRKDVSLQDHLQSLKPESRNSELANIASIIMQIITSKYGKAFCNFVFEATYIKNK